MNPNKPPKDQQEQATHSAVAIPQDVHFTLPPAMPEKLLRLPAVCDQTGLGKSSVYAIPDFPKPLVLSRRAVAWKQSEISAWIQSRTKRLDAKP